MHPLLSSGFRSQLHLSGNDPPTGFYRPSLFLAAARILTHPDYSYSKVIDDYFTWNTDSPLICTYELETTASLHRLCG